MTEVWELYVEKESWIVKVWIKWVEVKSRIADQYHPHVAAWVEWDEEIIIKFINIESTLNILISI